MKWNPYNENVLIVGDSGSGKTNFARYLARSLPPEVPWWIWDYNRDYHFSRTVHDINTLGYERTLVQSSDLSEKAFVKFAEKAESVRNIVVFIEEIQEYETPHKLVAESLLRTGRNKGVCWVAITQRPAELAKAVVSNAHHRFVFRLTLPSDIDFLQKWIHPRMSEVQSLPPFYYFYHNKTDGQPPTRCNPVPLTSSL